MDKIELHSYLEQMPADFLAGRSSLMLAAYRSGLTHEQVDEIDRQSIEGSIKTQYTYGQWFIIHFSRNLTISKLEKMEHAIGYHSRRVDNGTFRPFRNFYAQYEKDPEWEELVADQYATREQSLFGEVLYRLTDKAVDALSKALFINIIF